MFKKGNKVKVVGLPTDNTIHWGLPAELVGMTAIIASVRDKYYTIEIDNGNQFNFPFDCVGLLDPIVFNRWNPSGYVPRLGPMKLP